jgi:hypothetical protein
MPVPLPDPVEVAVPVVVAVAVVVGMPVVVVVVVGVGDGDDPLVSGAQSEHVPTNDLPSAEQYCHPRYTTFGSLMTGQSLHRTFCDGVQMTALAACSVVQAGTAKGARATTANRANLAPTTHRARLGIRFGATPGWKRCGSDTAVLVWVMG